MNKFTRIALLLGVAGIASAGPALAQMTDAQRSAIKSSCRSDYMNVCSSVPTGTKASLECLQQHAQQVSPGCQTALAAIAAPAAPAAVADAAAPAAASAAAAATAAPAAAAAAAPAASQAAMRDQMRVLRQSCSADFEKLCSGVSPGGGRGMSCLNAHLADLSPGCHSALSSLSPPK